MMQNCSQDRNQVRGRLWALLLVIGILAGCAQAPAPPQAQPSAQLPASRPAATRVSPQPTQAPTAAPTAPGEAAILTFAFPDDPQTMALAQSLIDDYTALGTAATIAPQPIPSQDYRQALLGTGRSFDLMLTTDTEAPALIANSVLLDIQPLLVEMAEPTPEHFHAVTLAPWEHGWSRYGLPISASPQVLFYNKSLFDASGESYPAANWTWEDWFASARRITETQSESQVYGLAIGGWTTAVWGNGGQLLNADNSQTLLDRPEAAEGVQLFADLVTAGVAPLPPAAGGLNPVELFKTQQVAMLPAVSSLAAGLAADLPFAWGIAPLPAGPTRAVPLSVAGLTIGADSGQQQAAFDFISWAVGRDGQRLRAQAQPHAASALQSPTPQPAGAPGGQLIAEAVQYGRTLPTTVLWPEVTNLVNAALVPVWKGETTAAAAYREVAPEINALLASGPGTQTQVIPGTQPRVTSASNSITTAESSVPTAPAATLPTTSVPNATPAPAIIAPQPTPVPRLRFVKLNEHDDSTCISVGIRGLRTQGWSIRIDGINLSGTFDSGGNARICGLAPRQEVTFTVLNGDGQPVRGGGGVPSIGGAIMGAEWR